MFYLLLPLLLLLAAPVAVASIAPSTSTTAVRADAPTYNDFRRETVATSSSTAYDAFGQRALVREKIAAQDNQYRHVYNALGELREIHVTPFFT